MRRLAAILSLTALALVMAPSAAAGGSCHWESAEWTTDATDADEVTAHIAGCRYEPTTLHIEPGTTVTWLNKDVFPHSVTGPFLTLNSDTLLNRGDRASVRFDEEGVYPYYCVLHPGMAASVVVGDPEASVTGSLAGMGPSGNYNADTPVEGASTEEANESSVVPVAAGAAIVTLATAAAAFLIRRRRRALPVPTAMP